MGRNNAREETEKALLEAALQVFAAKGYHNATIKDIVEAARVATGTFYLYFPSKESAFATLIDRLYQEAMAAIRTARQEHQGAIAKLEASLAAVLDFFGRRRELAKIILIQAAGADPVFDRKLAEIHNSLAYLVNKDLDGAVAQGLIPPLDTEIAARALVGTVYEVVYSWLRHDRPRDLADALPTLRAYNLRGIGVKDQ